MAIFSLPLIILAVCAVAAACIILAAVVICAYPDPEPEIHPPTAAAMLASDAEFARFLSDNSTQHL